MSRLSRCAWVLTLMMSSSALAAPTTKPATTTAPSADYRTVADAIRAKVAPPLAASNDPQVPYLGVALAHGSSSAAVVEHVSANSPAASAGVKDGDEIVRLGDKPVAADSFDEQLQAHRPGEPVTVAVRRAGKELSLTATLGTPSKPLRVSERRVIMGLLIKEASEGAGALVATVTADSPSAKAGIRVGDQLLDVDGIAMSSQNMLVDFLQSKTPEDTVTARIQRGGKPLSVRVKLTGETTRAAIERALDPNRFIRQNVWTKPVYRIAVIGVEYPDVKHSEKITKANWEELFFSTGTYDHKKNATGQDVHGSLNDFYQEQSYGKFHVEGHIFEWVTASKPRMDYGRGTGDNAGLLPEVLDKLYERDGKDVLKDYDGIFFLYAGGRVQTTRGGLYWPHKGYTLHKGKRWPFFIVPEGGEQMTNLSLCAHEFGHMLGIPDLYARPENPGSEGLGVWCLMSNQLGNGHPQHMSAWCKEQLGWIKPAVIDPRVKQKLLLSGIEGSPEECYKVLVRDDGSEYFLLENRQKAKFDGDLPAAGLLIWRVTRGHVTLEESHGVDGPLGPRSFLTSVPFPSPSNNAFTPYTTPSSRSQLGGGAHNVFITDVQRLDDGRIAFTIGYEVL